MSASPARARARTSTAPPLSQQQQPQQQPQAPGPRRAPPPAALATAVPAAAAAAAHGPDSPLAFLASVVSGESRAAARDSPEAAAAAAADPHDSVPATRLVFASTPSSALAFYLLPAGPHLRLSELDSLLGADRGRLLSLCRPAVLANAPLFEARSGDVLVPAPALRHMAPLAPAHSRLLNHLADLSPDAVRADPPAVSAAIAALAPMLNQAEAFVEVPITLAILRRPPSPRSLKRPADSDLADRADAAHHAAAAAHHAAAAAADASDESSSSQPANGADPTTPKDSASRAAKTSRKRLSIDTSLTERTAQLEAAVEAQRIRQKQQAIIEDRRRAASLNLPASALAQSRQRPRPLPSRGDVLSWTAASSSSSSSIDYLISPHADFPNRELPLPRGYTDPRSAHPLSSGRHMLPPAPATAHPSAPGASAHHLLPLPPHLAASASASAAVSGAGGAAANGTANGTTPHKPHININTSLASLPGSGAAAPATGAGAGSSGMPPLSALPPIMSRTAFLGVFESMYDQYESQTRLSIMLKDQIRKSATLLQTLQSSGQMIEGLVRGHFREMQVQYGEKFGAALTDLNRRLVAVEGALGLGSANGSDSFTASGALKSARPDTAGAAAAQAAGFSRGSPDKATAATLASIVERLDAIEKRYAREG